MLAIQGKRKTLVKIHRMENGVVCLTEIPPDSGNYFLPLIENGGNVEQFEVLEQEQQRLF